MYSLLEMSLAAKKKKLKTKETKINELQNEKMKILWSIFIIFSQDKITKDELEKQVWLKAI